MKPKGSLLYSEGMHALCFAISLLAQVVPPLMGPPSQPVKGLHKPMPLGAGVAELVHASLRDLGGGAVVVVEDELPLPMAKLTPGFQVFGGKVRLFQSPKGQPYDLPVFSWMDTNTVRSGPNVASRSYPMGWGY